MVNLIVKTPAEGMLPYIKGAAELSELALGKVTSIAPFKGQGAAVDKALGTPLPKIARSSSNAAWFSQGQYLMFDVDVPSEIAALGALTEQGDAWCALELKGDHAEDVLARLIPIDLRQSSFKRGHCARTQLGHMPLHITRTGKAAFRLMSFRSMAGTMVHEISRAMDLLAARG